MTFKEVATMVNSIGLPTAYYQFPEGTGQATPFVCFYFSADNDFKADNANYQKIEHLIVELYTDNKDFEMEAAVESALASCDMVWTRYEDYIDTERMNMVTYEMDVVITAEPEPPAEATNTTEDSTDGE